MKQTVQLSEQWRENRLGSRWQYKQGFELYEDFDLRCVYLEYKAIGEGVQVQINAVDVPVPDGAARLKVSDWLHEGVNEITVLSDHELPDDPLPGARLVSYDRASITRIEIEPEIVDEIANIWVTVKIANNMGEDQPVYASVVIAQGECRETVTVAENISPFGGEIEAVIRITDSSMWQPDDTGKWPLFKCLVGLEVEGNIADVASLEFDVS